jgi:glyoxalase-like protein
VVDEQQAAASTFGRWVASARYGRPFGWAVRTDDIEAVAERLGLEIADGARGDLRWQLAAVAEAVAEPCLPFFIEWAPGTSHPGNGTGGIERLELSGDPARLNEWLGPHNLPISVHPGTPGVVSLRLKDTLP